MALTYDADGNTQTQTDASGPRTFRYDARDRLMTLEQPNAPPLGFDYQSDGLRIAKRQASQETRYQYDQQSVLAETNSIGNSLARYHYSATQLISRTEQGSTPTQRHYLLDSLATPIALLTQQGSISARTKYDAWGEIVTQQDAGGVVTTSSTDGPTADLTRTDAQPIGYTGYLTDSESGLYYAKARYYDPRIARFTTEDPEEGHSMQPPSLHRYLYAYANPTVYTDPSGKEAWDERIALLNAVAAESDPEKRVALQTQYGVAETRFNARFGATLEYTRDTAVGFYQLGENIAKASWETSILGYTSGAGSEGVDALVQGGKHIATTLRHPIDNIYTPIHDQYVQANALDAQGQTFQAEYVRQKAVLATQDVALGTTGVYSLAKSAARGLAKSLIKAGAADAVVVVEDAAGAAACLEPRTEIHPFSRESTAGMPAWLRDRLKAGDDFNRQQAAKYPYNEVYVESPCEGGACLRLDSYDPDAGAIVSRKHTQLADIQPQTAINYLREIDRKYRPGTVIADVPSNRAPRNGESPIAGQRLRGQMYLEVPTTSPRF